MKAWKLSLKNVEQSEKAGVMLQLTILPKDETQDMTESSSIIIPLLYCTLAFNMKRVFVSLILAHSNTINCYPYTVCESLLGSSGGVWHIGSKNLETKNEQTQSR